jgi:hypothetical protein
METQMLTTNAVNLDALTYDYTKGGILLRRQLGKEILSNTGIWADVAFLHQDLNIATDNWKPAKVTIARFKRIGGIWKKQNHFNVNSAQRANQITAVLSKWHDRIGVDNV